METGSASGKRKKDEEDRISTLTDDLLLKIMSSLNSKEAVQTCVLSKRWECLWQFLPNLSLGLRTFPFEPESDEEGRRVDEKEIYRQKMASFSNFIVQFLLRRHPTDLDKVWVQFRMNNRAHCSLMNGLISYAVKHNIKNLTFHYNVPNSVYSFPKSFRNCQSLTSLDLVNDEDSFSYLELERLLVCPALKYLRLFDPDISGPNFEPTVFSGCPNLETLELAGLIVESGDKLNLCINGLNMKRLQLEFAKIEDEVTVEIYAPQLTSFKLSTYYHCCYAPILCLRDNVASLNDVHLDIKSPDEEQEHFHFYETYSLNEEEQVLHLINTINLFRLAKSLTLSTSTIEILAKFPSLVDQNRVPFANLKYLKIKVEKWQKEGFEMHACIVNYFLSSSPTVKICN